MVIPCNCIIQCSLAILPPPSVFLFSMGVSSDVVKECFKLVVCYPKISVEGLCIVPSTTRVGTVKVSM